MASKKKSSGGGGASSALRTVVAAAAGTAGTEGLIELVEKLGLVDIVVGRLKSRLEETDLDELFDDVKDYLKRNPEVLVVSLGALTVATGVLVFLNSRREWDGNERRGTGYTRTTVSTGRVRKAS
jgi:hypothetical protein